jgi:deoxyribose-phosphate aldolase
MKLEYYINSIDEKDQIIKNNLDIAIQYGLDALVSSHNVIKSIKKNYDTKLGVLIDYPISYNDILFRSKLIENSISIGIDFIVITVPFYLIVNRRYTKFREDINTNLEICKSANVDIRYMLEYRKFDHILLQKVCNVLKDCGINTIYPSTGLFLDNIDDNIIACSYLKQKTGINTIINANIWTQKHVKALHKADATIVSTNQIESLYLLNKYNVSQK